MVINLQYHIPHKCDKLAEPLVDRQLFEWRTGVQFTSTYKYGPLITGILPESEPINPHLHSGLCHPYKIVNGPIAIGRFSSLSYPMAR